MSKKKTATKDVPKDPMGNPYCPYCKKPTKRSSGVVSVTAMYFVPTYDKKGQNINPDRNTRTSIWRCLECGGDYIYKTNGEWEEIIADGSDEL